MELTLYVARMSGGSLKITSPRPEFSVQRGIVPRNEEREINAAFLKSHFLPGERRFRVVGQSGLAETDRAALSWESIKY
jgi:hypothetical protein